MVNVSRGTSDLCGSLCRATGRASTRPLEAAGGLIPREDHDAVRRHYERQTSTTIEVLEPGVLSDGGPRAWFDDYDPSKGYYWRRQRDFLAHELGRKDFEIDSLDRSSDKVLAHLENPQVAGGFRDTWSGRRARTEWQDSELLGSDRQGCRRRIQDRDRALRAS